MITISIDKLRCCIQTLTLAEISHFKSFLRGKAKSKNSKKEKLLEHILAGKQSEYIKKRLYNEATTNNAYYQLRRALMEDLECFLVLEQFNNHPSAQVYGLFILANRANDKAHSELARYYYDSIFEKKISKEFKKQVSHSISLLDELDFENQLIEFKSDLDQLDIAQLFLKFSFGFLTSLRKKDLMLLIKKLDEEKVNVDFHKTNPSYDELFVICYNLYVHKQFDESLVILNKIIQRVKFDPQITVKVKVWVHLLKAFVQTKKGLIEDGKKQLILIKNELLPLVGTQYKLIILRWSLVLHVQHLSIEQTTSGLLSVLDFKDELLGHIGKTQLLKLLVFAIDFSEKTKNKVLLEKTMHTSVDLCNLSCEFPRKSNMHMQYIHLLLDTGAIRSHEKLNFKSPENILLQYVRTSDRLPQNNTKVPRLTNDE
jgi:hypothetical protein